MSSEQKQVRQHLDDLRRLMKAIEDTNELFTNTYDDLPEDSENTDVFETLISGLDDTLEHLQKAEAALEDLL